jgi:UDP-glucose 4-epimerase
MNKPPKHILVTGGAGFIGSALVRRLLTEGYVVTVIDDCSNGRKENVPKEATFIKADLLEEKIYREISNISFDAVFHLAAQSSGALSFKDPMADMKSHLYITFSLLQLSLKKKVSRFMFPSSTTVYGDTENLPVDEGCLQNPKTYYATGKLACEKYIRFFFGQGLPTTIFRLPNVYGPGQNLQNKNQGMVSIYFSYLMEDEPIIVKGSKDRFRDFIYIDDVVEGWMRAFEISDSIGETYNLASGNKSTVEQVLYELKKACGRPNYPIEFTSGTPGDQQGITFNISKIQQEIGFSPKIDIREGLKKMVEVEMKK